MGQVGASRIGGWVHRHVAEDRGAVGFWALATSNYARSVGLLGHDGLHVRDMFLVGCRAGRTSVFVFFLSISVFFLFV